MTNMSKSNQILGFERDPNNHRSLKPLHSLIPEARDADLHRVDSQDLLTRFMVGGTGRDHAHNLLAQGAPQLLALVEKHRTARRASDRQGAVEEFAHVADAWMTRYAAQERASKTDSDLYALLSPVFQIPKMVERIYASPTLINELPKRALGTADEVGVYLEYEDHMPAVAHDWSYDPKEAAGATGTVSTRTINLAPCKASAMLSARDREKHEERRGRFGAVDFDLFGRRIDVALDAVMKRASQIVSWGDTVLGLTGFVDATNGVTAVNANYDSGTGLTDYATIATQINAQAAQVNWMEEFLADTIFIDPQSFYNLSSRLISNTGDSGDSVLERIFRNFPRIQRVVQARELAPLATEIAEETPKVGATEAALLGGGYLDGTYRRCMVITKNDPDVHEWFEGLPLSVQGLEPFNGADRAVIRMSTGGVRFYRTSVPRIVYI